MATMRQQNTEPQTGQNDLIYDEHQEDKMRRRRQAHWSVTFSQVTCDVNEESYVCKSVCR